MGKVEFKVFLFILLVFITSAANLGFGGSCEYFLLEVANWNKGYREKPSDYRRLIEKKHWGKNPKYPVEIYGENAWIAFREADFYLNLIPKGQFQLSLDLVLEVHKRMTDSVFHGLRKMDLTALIQGYFKSSLKKPGRMKSARNFGFTSALDLLSEKQFLAVQSNPDLTYVEFPYPFSAPDRRRVLLVFPSARKSAEQLIKLSHWVNEALKTRDPIEVAAIFQRRFTSIHPFPDGNGRTSRVIMDRILAEKNIPPPILDNHNLDLFSSEEEWIEHIRNGVSKSIEMRFTEAYGAIVSPASVLESQRLIFVSDKSFRVSAETDLIHDRFGLMYVLVENRLVPLSERTYQFLNTALVWPGSKWVQAKQATEEFTTSLENGQNTIEPTIVSYGEIREVSEKNYIVIPHEFLDDLGKSSIFKKPQNLYQALKISSRDRRTQFEQCEEKNSDSIPATQILAQYIKFQIELSEYQTSLGVIDSKFSDYLSERLLAANRFVEQYFSDFRGHWQGLSKKDQEKLLKNPVVNWFFRYLKYTPVAPFFFEKSFVNDLDQSVYLMLERHSSFQWTGIHSDNAIKKSILKIPMIGSFAKQISKRLEESSPLKRRMQSVLYSRFNNFSAEVELRRKFIEFYLHHIDSTNSSYISMSSNVDLYRATFYTGIPRYSLDPKNTSLFIVRVPRKSVYWNSFTEYSHVYEFLKEGSISSVDIIESIKITPDFQEKNELDETLSAQAKAFYRKFLHGNFFMPILPNPTVPNEVVIPGDIPRATSHLAFPRPQGN